jgi:hypothetical protein
VKIRDELIEIGCRAMCDQNNEDPDYVSTLMHVTLGRIPMPNWEYRKYTVTPIVDAVIERLRSRAASL